MCSLFNSISPARKSGFSWLWVDTICDCLCKNQPSSHQNLNSLFWLSLWLYSIAIHTACLLWPDSSGLLFWGEDLRPCKAMTDTLTPVERTNWALSTWNSTLDWNDVPSAWLYGRDHLWATQDLVSSPGEL